MNFLIPIGENRYQTERIPAENNDCPIFSTICLHTLVKTGGPNSRLNDHDKYSALDQVKLLFKYLLDFFYTNQIAVCFASIKSNPGCLTNLPALARVFTTPIQIYAFTMLRTVGYSVEQKIHQQNSFRTSLCKLADNDDDKFYRLCLYLFRRSTEYHFLNVSYREKKTSIYLLIEYFSSNMN
jgi:hypothetical protein